MRRTSSSTIIFTECHARQINCVARSSLETRLIQAHEMDPCHHDPGPGSMWVDVSSGGKWFFARSGFEPVHHPRSQGNDLLVS